MNPTQTKPITAGEMLEKYAARIELLEDALVGYYVADSGGPGPSMAQHRVAEEAARKLDALPVQGD